MKNLAFMKNRINICALYYEDKSQLEVMTELASAYPDLARLPAIALTSFCERDFSAMSRLNQAAICRDALHTVHFCWTILIGSCCTYVIILY